MLQLPASMSPTPRRSRVRLLLAALLVCGSGAQCRSRGPGPAPQFLGDARSAGGRVTVDPSSPLGRSWTDLLQARDADPASPDVATMARDRLADDPPLGAKLAAWAALAEQAYLAGDDTAAVAWANQGLAAIDPTDLPSNPDARAHHADLAQTMMMAAARGGDPAQALTALDDPVVSAALTDDVRLGARAVALDRSAQPAAAALAYLQWRASVADDDPSAPWAEHRARVLARGVPVTALTELAESLEPSPARACLQAQAGGEAPDTSQPRWVQRCAEAVDRIGILLPRTGPLSALADQQLVAATAAADVLGSRHGAVEIVWADPGSSAAGARKAARELQGLGADVIVGPIGPKLVAATATEVGDALPIVVPGEGRGVAKGVAPSLEARVDALVAVAIKQGKTRLVVLAPDNAYGKRAIAAAEKGAAGMTHAVVVRTYEASATSFAKTLSPITTALSEGSAVLIADHMSRAELVVRQLARLGKVPAKGDDGGLMVMTTAEGASQAGLDRAGSVFEGVWASPVASAAAAGSGGKRFATAYARMADELPGDQAMLVYFAMHMAFTGRAAKGSGRAPIVRVTGGEFVAPRAGGS